MSNETPSKNNGNLDRNSSKHIHTPEQLYKKAKDSFWTPDEIELHEDICDWDKRLQKDEKAYLLALIRREIISYQDSEDVSSALKKLPSRSARFFAQFQVTTENIHIEALEDLVKCYADKPNLTIKERTISENRNLPSILLGMIIRNSIEQAIFSTSCMWIKQRGLLPGLALTNELMTRDINLHLDFAVSCYNLYCRNAYSNDEVIAEIQKAIDREKTYLYTENPIRNIGLSPEFMLRYMEYVADEVL